MTARRFHGWRGILQSRHYRKPRRNIVRLRHSSSQPSRLRCAKFFRSRRLISERRSSALSAHCSKHSSSLGMAIATARNVLRVVGLLHVISASSCALARNSSRSLYRFLAGIAVGGSSILALAYLAEVAPANRRGALVDVPSQHRDRYFVRVCR
jgi:hypothetical protein